MSALRIGAVLILMCGPLAACSNREPVPESPPPNRGLRPAPEAPEPAEVPEEEPEAPAAPADWQQPAAEEKPAEAVVEGAAQEAKEEDKPPPRDYGAELRSLISDASSCMKRRTDPNAPGEVTVSIQAVVMESGMVTRAYASASALDSDETACLQRRVSALHMNAPVEAAPRTINTSLTLQLQRAPAVQPVAAPTEGMGETQQGSTGIENRAPDPYAIPAPQPGTPAEQPSQPEQPQ